MWAMKSRSVWNPTRTACHRRETSLGSMVDRPAQRLRTCRVSGAETRKTVVQTATTLHHLGLAEDVRSAVVARVKRSLRAIKTPVTRADLQCSQQGPQRHRPGRHLDLQCPLLLHRWRLTSHTSCLRGQRSRPRCHNQGLQFYLPRCRRLSGHALGLALDLVLAACNTLRRKGGRGHVKHAN